MAIDGVAGATGLPGGAEALAWALMFGRDDDRFYDALSAAEFRTPLGSGAIRFEEASDAQTYRAICSP